MMADKKTDNTVFYVSLGIVVALLAWGILAQEHFANFSNNLLAYLTTNFSWAYLASMFSFVAFSLILAFSKYGSIKLGADDSKPEFSTASWFAMLFGAGMGIGLVFWGVAEPISHLTSPPPGLEPGTPETAAFAMGASFKHWGIHAWSSYSIIGLALAYFQFRKGAPAMISSLFLPLIGEKGVKGPIGKTIDVLAVFATVAGVATSFGLGTLQINSGLNFLFGTPESNPVALIIIAVITVVFIWTAVSGVEKGIKILGDINLYLALSFLLLAFLVGPKVKILNSLFAGFGAYLNNFVQGSFELNAYGDNSWVERLDGILLGMVDRLGPVCRILHCAYFQRPYHQRICARCDDCPGNGLISLVCGIWHFRGEPYGNTRCSKNHRTGRYPCIRLICCPG